MFFVWMLLIGILLPVFRDEKVIEQWGKTEVEVMKYIPIPPMIIGYPLIILTLWIYGPLSSFSFWRTGPEALLPRPRP